ncbi:uncharacterized protein LOC116928402 [Daphnia magna]|uniref:uncharacterized protein LOC116928402 n=1 Tax=Daphnia magna TaxID=35525 RepID=UPI001E1BBB40|nr:uncharacterized protein LOC116928402 [Daphnia magna]
MFLSNHKRCDSTDLHSKVESSQLTDCDLPMDVHCHPPPAINGRSASSRSYSTPDSTGNLELSNLTMAELDFNDCHLTTHLSNCHSHTSDLGRDSESSQLTDMGLSIDINFDPPADSNGTSTSNRTYSTTDCIADSGLSNVTTSDSNTGRSTSLSKYIQSETVDLNRSLEFSQLTEDDLSMEIHFDPTLNGRSTSIGDYSMCDSIGDFQSSKLTENQSMDSIIPDLDNTCHKYVFENAFERGVYFILENYRSSGNVEAAILHLQTLNEPSLHYQMVHELLMQAVSDLGLSETRDNRLVKLLMTLVLRNLVTMEHIKKGCFLAFEELKGLAFPTGLLDLVRFGKKCQDANFLDERFTCNN